MSSPHESSESFSKSLEPKAPPKTEAPSAHMSPSRPPVTKKQPVMKQLLHSNAKLISEKTKVHTQHRPRPEPTKEERRHAHHRRKRFEVFAAVFLFFLLAFIIWLSASTNTGPFIVLVSFIPTIFTVVIGMIVYEAHKDNKNILWPIPLVLIFAFYWLGTNMGGVLKNIDVDTLTALNVLFSFLYLIVNYFLLQKPLPKAKGEVKVVVKEREVIPDNLSKFIASIEDKGKALNFVIGRVYNAYHGGTKELRQKINVKQEWYDQFSQIPSDPNEVDYVALSSLISTIESRLHLLEKSEKQVFGDDSKNFKNLVRSDDGSDAVLAVLDKNDKDPVTNYVEGALQFCGKVKDFISKRKDLGVENKYVKRPDEGKKTAAPRSSWSAKH